MKFAAVLLAGALALGVGPARAENPTIAHMLKALLGQKASAPAERATVITGKVVFKVTINIVSAIPADALPICDGMLLNLVADGEYTLSELASQVSTRKGKTATCSVTVPYRWSNPDTFQPIRTSLTVHWEDPAAPKAGATVLRQSQNDAAPIDFPKNGATTTRSFTVDF